MFRGKRAVVVTICTGFLWVGIVGCAARSNSEVGTSLQPLPNRPPGRISSLVRAEEAPPSSGVETGPLPSTRVAQTTPVTENLTVPVQLAQQPQSVAQRESPQRVQTQPALEPMGAPTPARPPTPLPPPAAGYPERLPPSPLMAPDLPEMSLDQLIQIALDNQPNIRSAQAALEGADARVGIARSGYFPVIGTTTTYNRQTSNQAGGVNPATGNISRRSVTGISRNRQDFTARFSQNVFDSFRREWNIQATREDQTAAKFDLSTTRQDVVLRRADGLLQLPACPTPGGGQ